MHPPRIRLPRLAVLLPILLFPLVVNAEDYRHGPDSIRKPDVPKGTVTAHRLENSSVFEGTQRRYNVYVPAQYDGSQPAALMVFQDGHAFVKETGDFRVPIVFDNLIASGDMPITIAVMVDPGNRGRLPEKRGWNQGTNNRSVEYDTVSPAYGDFLIQDLLPVIAKDYKLTTNPDLRAICGNSSGGICAFGVAWHHPDSFRKVLSHIGSFVDIRGGHNYPPMIRKQDKRPLRVFLQDGENDLDNRFGNWPLANRQMAKALAYRDYDYKLVFGDGKHNGKHAGTIFPESLKWLWRDWETLAP